MLQIAGQIISIVGMCTLVFSFQCKSNRNLILSMTVSALLFAGSFLLLGSYVSAAINLLSLGANLACLKEELKNKVTFGIIALLFVVATIFTFESWWSPVLMLAQLLGIFAMMFGSGRFIRNTRLFFTSPVWLINNTLVVFSLGGMLAEIFTMLSIVVSFIRYRKTGFEK